MADKQYYNPMNHDSIQKAGPVFTNGIHVLAGYQGDITKRPKFISGIGGKREEGEAILDTVMREALEELFHIESVPKALLKAIHEACIPSYLLDNDGYCLARYTFKDLETLLSIAVAHGISSPLYQKMPLTLMDLILCRCVAEKGQEIGHLVLLPFVSWSEHDIREHSFVKRHFLRDMALLGDKNE